MTSRSTRDRIVLAIAGFTPFVGVGLVRHIAGVAGPSAAQADMGSESFDGSEGERESLLILDRSVVIPAPEAASLAAVAQADISSWETPLFGGAPEEDTPETPVTSPPTDRPAPPGRSQSAALFADQFRLTSLMAARGGAVAVIDRKLRRVGDEIGSGVVIDSIDLENRVVHLRATDGTVMERRPNR